MIIFDEILLMKKVLLTISLLSALYFVKGQDFKKQNVDNQRKLEQYFSKSQDRFSQKEKDSLSFRLAGFAGEIPLFYKSEDTGANASSNIDDLQNGLVSGLGNITGSGIKITVFDEGKALASHEQFSTDRVVNKEGADYIAHSTNVTSVLIGNGTGNSNAKGVLPSASTDNYLYSKTSLGTNFVKLATLPNLNISNHSYGTNLGWSRSGTANTYYWYGAYDLNVLDTYSGAYGENDYNFDRIVYSKPEQIIVKSAGNYYGVGPNESSLKYRYNSTTKSWVQFQSGDVIPAANCSLGYNCIGFGSLAKNIIVVGSVNQLTTENKKYTKPSDVVKASTSSAGPRKDGAIKPDLTAVGVDMVMATYSTGNSSYITSFGTSFAAPIVTGIAGAMTQIQRNILSNASFIFKADEMKALLTHTANDAGRPGPDVWYGWGLVDAKKAAQVLVKASTKDAIVERNTLQSGVVYSKEIKALGSEDPLKFSLSWVDPAITYFTDDTDLQNNHASRLVNDLDLKIIDTVTNVEYYPWRLDISNPNADATKGDNLVDNIEQVVVDSPVAGRTYRIVVSNKGTLKNQDGISTTQDFALLGTGIETVTLGVNDVAKETVKVYPTRTLDIVNVVGNEFIEKLTVFDMNGKIVLESNNKAQNQLISLANYPNGVYLLVIKNKSGVISKKLIKE